jgi:hypothetical protein
MARQSLNSLATYAMCSTGRMATRKKTMSNEHKAALAEGRSQSRAVSRYLEALEANRPKRGRKRTPDSIKARLAKLEDELTTAEPLAALNLRQERIDLQAELAAMNAKVDMGALEAGFTKAAKGYSERKGITYAVWRESGVPAAVLKKSGITRGAA